MIQTADVGIGISGLEGMEAVNNSDYAIAQFRFLRRLLLVHGRWNYIRISKCADYTFYRNILYCSAMCWYAYYCSFSGTMFYNIWFQNFMSLLYTALPVILLAIWDQDVPHYMAERIPELYLRFLNQQVFNIKVFWRWAFEALFEAIIIFAVPVLGVSHYQYQTIEGLGGISFAGLMLVVSLKIVIHAHTWNWIQKTVWWVSLLCFFGTASWWGLSTPVMLEEYGVTYWVWDTFPGVMLTVDFWACSLLTVVLSLGKDVVWKVYSRAWMPKPYHIVQEVCVLHPENEQALLEIFTQAGEENSKVELEEVITRAHAAKSMSTAQVAEMDAGYAKHKKLGTETSFSSPIRLSTDRNSS
jgi:magnesium-transporting ATPase (P-type)